jgi:hypothetical protein
MRLFLFNCEVLRALHAFLRPREPAADFFSLFEDGLAAIGTARDGAGAYTVVIPEDLITLLRPLRGRRHPYRRRQLPGPRRRRQLPAPRRGSDSTSG